MQVNPIRELLATWGWANEYCLQYESKGNRTTFRYRLTFNIN